MEAHFDSAELVENAISIRLPDYNPRNPRVWFHQVEAVFATRRIASQVTRFSYVVQHLPCDVATEVEDLLEDIPKENPYDALRAAVISRTGKSENKMLRDLFTTVELGDRSPSQLLRHMRSLLCGRKLAEEIMAQLWLDELPPSMSHVISALVDEHSIEQLARMADKIHETYPSNSVNSVSSPAHTTNSAPLLASISRLQAKFDALTDRLQRTVFKCDGDYGDSSIHGNLIQRLKTTRHTHNCTRCRVSSVRIVTAGPLPMCGAGYEASSVRANVIQ
ncbi:hypothetical protein T265_00184 [Opisthorchis viverrini]|uniref:DUF7041 domain-containing protein n=1 Tax=Opisthorchis viverrini TaxID=6198 RepID=A0A075AJU2_OPIVI|nr:hypothetical protein T265_00184 [Opisthorchis viverrini]KER33979.1 hypothetical protein T265_00184 [Opisthorchis viverrini]